jgi:nicotinamidase-related amidase
MNNRRKFLGVLGAGALAAPLSSIAQQGKVRRVAEFTEEPRERTIVTDITFYKSNTALLIADFYADQMSKLPHAVNRKCVEKTLALRQAARAAGMLVCYSATVFRPGYIEISERNKTFSERKRTGGPAIADPLKIIHPQVQPAEGEPVVGKHRVNAMFGTDLTMILGARNVDTLILLGFATSGVVLSTTRYAADADYRLFIVEDCCADTDPAVHDFLCTKIFPRQADVVQSADVIKVLAA